MGIVRFVRGRGAALTKARWCEFTSPSWVAWPTSGCKRKEPELIKAVPQRRLSKPFVGTSGLVSPVFKSARLADISDIFGRNRVKRLPIRSRA